MRVLCGTLDHAYAGFCCLAASSPLAHPADVHIPLISIIGIQWLFGYTVVYNAVKEPL
jgi:hypothetical protein